MTPPYDTVCSSSVILAGFLLVFFTIGQLFPRRLVEKVFLYATITIPPHLLFLITAIFAIYQKPICLIFFVISCGVEFICFLFLLFLFRSLAKEFEALEEPISIIQSKE